jgi:hypothetical protein
LPLSCEDIQYILTPYLAGLLSSTELYFSEIFVVIS